MPAIQPEKSKYKIEEMLINFHNPDEFVQKLNDLFDLYANRIRKISRSGIPQTLIKQYHIPKPILRQITQTCIPKCQHYPKESLDIIDTLWEQNILEYQLIAGQLLGHLPIEYKNDVIARVYDWNRKRSDPEIRQLLGKDSFYTLRRESPDELIKLIEKWLNHENLDTKKLAISILFSLVEENQYKDMAAIFQLCNSLMQSKSTQLRNDLLILIEALLDKYPSEIVYMLKTSYQKYPNQTIAYLIRKTLHKFPEDIQISLRCLLSTQN